MDSKVLAEFEEVELLAELKRRRDLEKPKPIKNPDIANLVCLCNELVVNPVHKCGFYKKSSWEAIFIETMICLYGPDIKEDINDRWEDY